mgnify:CR=1 FL=1
MVPIVRCHLGTIAEWMCCNSEDIVPGTECCTSTANVWIIKHQSFAARSLTVSDGERTATTSSSVDVVVVVVRRLSLVAVSKLRRLRFDVRRQGLRRRTAKGRAAWRGVAWRGRDTRAKARHGFRDVDGRSQREKSGCGTRRGTGPCRTDSVMVDASVVQSGGCKLRRVKRPCRCRGLTLPAECRLLLLGKGIKICCSADLIKLGRLCDKTGRNSCWIPWRGECKVHCRMFACTASLRCVRTGCVT